MTRADGSLRLVPRLLLLLPTVAGLWFAASPLIAAGDPTNLTFYAAYVSIGVLLAIRRPDNVVGWIVIGLAFCFLGTSPPLDVDVPALQAGRASARDAILVWISAWAGSAGFLLFATLAIVFPSGRLPATGRSRRASIAILIVGTAAVLVSTLAPGVTVPTPDLPEGTEVPNPIGVVPASDATAAVPAVAIIVLLALFVVSMVMLLVRYRREQGVAKLQLRWVLTAIAVIILAICFGLVTSAVAPDLGGLAWVPAVIAYPTLPLAIAIAIFRYRLYEIDRIVNRAIVYGSVTAILAGALAAASAVSQRVLSDLAGGSSEFAIVAITLLVATLYTPLRKRMETVADQYFKYEQRQFGAYRDELRRVADLVDPTRAASRLAVEALAETRASGVAVIDPAGTVLASAGTWPVDVVARVALTGTSSAFGAILVGARIDGHRHAPRVLAALADVASLADLNARAGILAPAALTSIAVADQAIDAGAAAGERIDEALPAD